MAWPCTQGFEVEDKEGVPVDRWAERKWNSFSSGTRAKMLLCVRYAVPGTHWKGWQFNRSTDINRRDLKIFCRWVSWSVMHCTGPAFLRAGAASSTCNLGDKILWNCPTSELKATALGSAWLWHSHRQRSVELIDNSQCRLANCDESSWALFNAWRF